MPTLFMPTLSAQTYVFHGANLIDGLSNHEIHNTRIIVKDDEIICVGGADDCNEFTEGEDTEWIDLTGNWVIPGLIDLHFHMWFKDEINLMPLLEAGVTTVQEVGPIAAADTGSYDIGHGQVERMADLSERIERGELPGPRIQYCGPQIFSSDNPYSENPRAIQLRSGEDISQVVNYIAERGASCIKLISGVTSEHMEKVLTAVSEAGIRGIGHSNYAISFEKQLKWNWAQIHHNWVPAEDLLPHDHRVNLPDSGLARFFVAISRFDPSTAEAIAFARQIASYEIDWIPTLARGNEFPWGLSGSYWYNLLLDTSEPQDEAIIREAFLEIFDTSGINTDTTKAMRDPFVEFGKQLTGLFHNNGVTILAGSDSSYDETDLTIHDELEYLVEAGLSPMEAIMAATSNAALALGLQNQIGTITAGKKADFIILEANPLDDIQNSRSIRKVVFGGKILDL